MHTGKTCNKYSAVLKSTRTCYYSNLVDQCVGDSKKLFKLIKFLCNGRDECNLPPHKDLANNFGEFFVKKIDLIKDSISNIQVDLPFFYVTAAVVKLERFSSLSTEDVGKLIHGSSNPSCSLDLIPTWLLMS